MLLTFGIVSVAMPVLAVLVFFLGAVVPFIGICSWVFVIVGLVMGIMAWVMSSGDLKKIRAGRISQEAQGGTKGGYITGIIGTILNLLYILCSCIALIAFLAFGMAILGGAAAAGANKPSNNPGFGGPGPRRSFQLPMPKLADYLPTRIG
jgi:hypothetical protein